MAIEITLPRLGWSMDEGVFVQWLKQDGEAVQTGEPLFSLETEKAVQEVEATDAGTLALVPGGPVAGDTVTVGQVLGYLLAEGETRPEGLTAAAPAAGETPAASHAPAGAPAAPTDLAPTASAPAVSPRAARRAAALGVDLREVTGSGYGGRIREQDVQAAAGRQPATTAKATTTPMATATAGTVADQEVPLTTARRMIAERMVQSQSATAAVTLMTRVDATGLVTLRQQLRAAIDEASEPVPTYTDILLKLTAVALASHPDLNARWADDRVVRYGRIDLGIAVDTESGLVVPVLRQVPNLSLGQVAVRSRDLIERARARRLSADEMTGSTFTVSNLGPMGIDAFTPIINYPECAILGVGRIIRQPAVVGDQVVPRDQLSLSLTFDHRVVDGAPAARFLDHLRRLLENPGARLIL